MINEHFGDWVYKQGKGLFRVRSSSAQRWRWGYTTGTCAAAAAKAALEYLQGGKNITHVEVELPDGSELKVPVKEVKSEGHKVKTEVIKDAGDDLDITHGISVWAEVKLNQDSSEVKLFAGKGIGWVTKPGLSVPVGEPAINPAPRRMIEENLQKLLSPGQGVEVTLEVPEGEALAGRTFNPRLGISGGISLLGTTGRVRPMSREAYLEALIPQIDQSLALGYQEILFTPGGKGHRKAWGRGVPSERIVEVGNFFGEMLDAGTEKELSGVLLWGHLGKMIKLAGGIFNTHSRTADARKEILAAHAAQAGAAQKTINSIMELSTLEASGAILQEAGLESIYFALAEEAAKRCVYRTDHLLRAGVVLYDLEGRILGWNPEAENMGERWGCPQLLK